MANTEDGFVKAQFYLALGVLLSTAVLVVYLGSRRLLHETLEKRKKGHSFDEVLSTNDTLALPLMGSMVLFLAYVSLRFIPLEYFNMLISFYLSIVGVFALGMFLKTYINPNVFTGIFCCAVGGVYYMTNSWVANNLLAVAIGVTAISSVHMGSFKTSFVMLLGLFFYDIFWVFGSDVMLTVASGINGPIKLVFPRTLFGDHKSVSLLGLGDLIIPGFFIAQTLIFSSECVKRSGFYFHITLVAYALSLMNTMGVMVFFEHGQPALLFIVPWLLITFSLSVVLKGDANAALAYTSDDVTTSCTDSTKKKNEDEPLQNSVSSQDNENEHLTTFLWTEILQLFGLDRKDGETNKCPQKGKISPKEKGE